MLIHDAKIAPGRYVRLWNGKELNMATMYNYWALIRNSNGAPMRVTLQATSAYEAIQLFRALYGSNLMSEGANAF
jgi:hypothetical protein